MDFSLQSGNQISLKRDEKQTPFAFMTRKVNGDVDYFNVILIGISVILLLVSFALYFYNTSLAQSVAEKKTALDQKQTEIKNLPITEIRSLYKKLKYANQLTNNYHVMDTMFALLGDSIENTAIYNSLSLNRDDKTSLFGLTILGDTDSYKTLTQQRNSFFLDDQLKYFTDTKISNFTLDKKTGRVNFKLTANIKLAGILPDSDDILLFGTVRSASSSKQ